MKRPQGYDRPPAPAAPPATPEPRKESRRAPRGVQTVTAPIPLVPAPADERSAHDVPGADAHGSAGTAGGGASRSPYDTLPTNREISKALRAARKERRRIERGEVRRFTKRSRRRRLAWLAAAGVVVLLVLGVAGVAVSPLLALRHIEITGASRLDPADIRAKLGDQLGTPLPMLDQAAISSDLAAFPLIRSYSLESHPPDTLVVRIEERQPVGVIQKGAVFTLVDAAKVPISSSRTRPEGYPLVTATGGSIETDADSAFAAVAGVLSALPPTVLAQVDTIAAKTKDDVSFTLRGSGATVVWGSAEDSDLKAADLTALLAGASGANRYDVSSPHSVTTG